MTTTDTILDEIETALIKKRDTAKRFRDQSAKEAQSEQPTRLECEWLARAEAYGTSLKLVREIRAEKEVA